MLKLITTLLLLFLIGSGLASKSSKGKSSSESSSSGEKKAVVIDKKLEKKVDRYVKTLLKKDKSLMPKKVGGEIEMRLSLLENVTKTFPELKKILNIKDEVFEDKAAMGKCYKLWQKHSFMIELYVC